MPRYCEFTGSPGHPFDEAGLKQVCPHAGFEFCTLFRQPLTTSPEGWRLCLGCCDRPVYVVPDKPTSGAPMLRLTRLHIIRNYKGKMRELAVTVTGRPSGWSIIMRTPPKNDGLLPSAQYSKYSHLVKLRRSDRNLLDLLDRSRGTSWVTASHHGIPIASMRSLVERLLIEFKDPLPKVKVWEYNFLEWEQAVLSTPFRLTEYGHLVIGAWSWYEWVYIPGLGPKDKVPYPHNR